MALTLGDNISYKGKKPLDERFLFPDLASMKSLSENYLPSLAICQNEETGNLYVYNVDNEIDITLGKWREFKGGIESIDEIISSDANNAIKTGSDNKAFVEELANKDVVAELSESEEGHLLFKGEEVNAGIKTVSDVISDDENNAITLGSDDKAFVEIPENKEVLDKLSKTEDGNLLFDGKEIKGGLSSVADIVSSDTGNLLELGTDDKAYVKDLDNRSVVDKLSEDEDGGLLYDGEQISGGIKNIDEIISTDADNKVVKGTDNKLFVAETDISGKVDKEDGKSLVADTDIAQITTNKNAIETLNGNVDVEGSVDRKISNAIAGITQPDEVVVDILPEVGKKGTLYFVPNNNPESPNLYDEFIWIEEESRYEAIYGKNIDLSGYAKTTDLDAYAKTTDLDAYAKTTDLDGFLTEADLDGYAKIEDLPTDYITEDDLTDYAKREEIPTDYIVESDLEPYAKKTEIPTDYVTEDDLSGYAKVEDIPTDYVTEADLGDYAKTADVVAKEDGKGLSSNDYTNADKEKLDGIDLSGYATTQNLATKVDIAQGTANKGKVLVVGEDGNVTVGEGGGSKVDIVTEFETDLSDEKVPSEKLVKDSLDKKVDVVAGKGLSTVDFTDTNYVHTDNNYDASAVAEVAKIADKADKTDLPKTATKDALGLVKPDGTTIDIDENGVIKTVGGGVSLESMYEAFSKGYEIPEFELSYDYFKDGMREFIKNYSRLSSLDYVSKESRESSGITYGIVSDGSSSNHGWDNNKSTVAVGDGYINLFNGAYPHFDLVNYDNFTSNLYFNQPINIKECKALVIECVYTGSGTNKAMKIRFGSRINTANYYNETLPVGVTTIIKFEDFIEDYSVEEIYLSFYFSEKVQYPNATVAKNIKITRLSLIREFNKYSLTLSPDEDNMIELRENGLAVKNLEEAEMDALITECVDLFNTPENEDADASAQSEATE